MQPSLHVPVIDSFRKEATKTAVRSSVKKDADDDLLYDAEADDEDSEWIERKRQEYLLHPTRDPLSRESRHPLPSSDAVLNCPACMVLLCLDCQRHETYKTQYRWAVCLS